jgi:phospholipid/cholesterol/gamma-HCH transport system substrate-binding protein
MTGSEHFPSTGPRRMYGLAGILLTASVAAVLVATYQQVFTPTVDVRLEADRAGLLMDPGADVRVDGVPVGKVRSVTPNGGGGAVLALALDPESAGTIPSGVDAEIERSTTFGAKHVTLAAPDAPVTRPIRSGETIRVTHVTAEMNDVFASLQDLLTRIDPAQLNGTLTAIATALEGRGDSLGQSSVQLGGYLRQLNRELGALSTDLATTDDVLDTYADIAPSLMRIADHASTTSLTLTSQEAALHAVLLDVTRTAESGTEFLGRAGDPLVDAMAHLRPVLRLAATFAPVLTCTVQGLNEDRRRAEATIGNNVPAIQALAGFLPAHPPYRYPRDLPKVGLRDEGPDCHGLPYLGEPRLPQGRQTYDDGQEAFTDTGDQVTVGVPRLYDQLFGVPR